MKMIKKLLAVAMSTLLAGINIPVSATNVSILQGDANSDNSVNVRDVAWLNRYLKGKECADSYNITSADVNRDGIIDYQDYNMILDNISETPVTYQTELYDNLNDEERAYYKFIYSNGKTTDKYDYTLYESNVATYNNTLRTTEDIPEFIRDYSNTGVVRVGAGSGFIVDDHLVITAAHCVCNWELSDPEAYQNLTVTVYNNDETSSKTYTIDSVHVPQKYYSDNSAQRDVYDYALIHIDDHYDNIPIRTFSQYEPFQIGYVTNEFIRSGGTIVTSGFTVDPDLLSENHRYYSIGSMINKEEDTDFPFDLRYHANAGANGGDSGGLAYYNSNYNNEIIKSAIGNITGGGENADYKVWGVRMTPTIARFIFNNENI